MMYGDATDPPVIRASSDNHLAEVIEVADVGRTGRIKIRLLSYDGATDQDGPIEARVCVPFAGNNRGSFFIPDVGDEVVVSFINGDARQPIVVGALWNGSASPPDQLAGDRVDRWTLQGRRGTRVALIEETEGSATIELETQGGGKGTFTQESGGAIELSAAGSKIRIDSSGVTIESAASVSIQASAGTQVQSPTVDVTAGQSSFSGVVTTPTVQATAVIGTSYTPGAGNVW
jgi:uncharacterized protein involved in type VI secretion and phage assembly